MSIITQSNQVCCFLACRFIVFPKDPHSDYLLAVSIVLNVLTICYTDKIISIETQSSVIFQKNKVTHHFLLITCSNSHNNVMTLGYRV